MSCGCVTEVDYCITRGTNFRADVSFSVGFVELIEDPDLYEGVMVFRQYQSDDAPVYLTLRSDIVEVPPEVPASLSFTATPTQTLALPDYDVVGYCDLQLKDGTSIQRLFTMEVEVK